MLSACLDWVECGASREKLQDIKCGEAPLGTPVTSQPASHQHGALKVGPI